VEEPPIEVAKASGAGRRPIARQAPSISGPLHQHAEHKYSRLRAGYPPTPTRHHLSRLKPWSFSPDRPELVRREFLLRAKWSAPAHLDESIGSRNSLGSAGQPN